MPLPARSGSVRGLQETVHKPLGGEVKCMDVSPILEGRTGAPFLAVGMADASVRIFSLGAEDMLEPRATQVSLGFRVWGLGFSCLASGLDMALPAADPGYDRGLEACLVSQVWSVSSA